MKRCTLLGVVTVLAVLAVMCFATTATAKSFEPKCMGVVLELPDGAVLPAREHLVLKGMEVEKEERAGELLRVLNVFRYVDPNFVYIDAQGKEHVPYEESMLYSGSDEKFRFAGLFFIVERGGLFWGEIYLNGGFTGKLIKASSTPLPLKKISRQTSAISTK